MLRTVVLSRHDYAGRLVRESDARIRLVSMLPSSTRSAVRVLTYVGGIDGNVGGLGFSDEDNGNGGSVASAVLLRRRHPLYAVLAC